MNEEITEKYLAELEEKLITGDRIRIETSSKSEWAKSFSEEGGICVLWEDDKICYCGETGNFHTRAKNLIYKGGHTARKNIGFEKFSKLPGFVKPELKTFSPNLEEELDRILEASFEITVFPVDTGRSELKKRIINNHNPFYNK